VQAAEAAVNKRSVSSAEREPDGTSSRTDAASQVIVANPAGEVLLGPEAVPEPITVWQLAQRVSLVLQCHASQCRFVLGSRALRVRELIGGGNSATPLELILLVSDPLSLDIAVIHHARKLDATSPDVAKLATARAFLKHVDSYMTWIASEIDDHLKADFQPRLRDAMWRIKGKLDKFLQLWVQFQEALGPPTEAP